MRTWPEGRSLTDEECAVAKKDVPGFWSVFWGDKDKRDEWPRVAALARMVLTVQASEVNCERVFRVAREVCADFRASMSEELFAALILLRGNWGRAVRVDDASGKTLTGGVGQGKKRAGACT